MRRRAVLRMMLAGVPLMGIPSACPPKPWRRWAQIAAGRFSKPRTVSGAAALTPASTSSRAFATAPTRAGAAFFRPSRPTPWTGVRDALEFGPVAPQPSTGGRADERRLPASQRLDARPARQREASRHGLVPRRRVFERHQQRDRNRRRASQPQGRRRRRHRQPSTERVRLSASRRVRIGRSDRFRQRRPARSDSRARMGARQHRGVRRRSRQRDDLRPLGWRREDAPR